MEETGSWEVLTVDNDYEIFTKPPHAVRRIGKDKIVSECINKSNGYVCLALNGKMFYKHRVIAIQFIENPDNLPQVDHVNRIKTDNRVENLRFVSHLENNNNKASNGNRKIEYVDELDKEAIKVKKYNNWKFEDLYFHDNKFYKWNGLQYRIIPLHQTQIGYYSIITRDKNNEQHNISYTKFKKQYGLE